VKLPLMQTACGWTSKPWTRIVAIALLAFLCPTSGRAQSVPAGDRTPKPPSGGAATHEPPTTKATIAGYVLVNLTANPKDTDDAQIVSFRTAVASGGAKVDCATVGPAGTYTIAHLAQLVACAEADAQIDHRAKAATEIKKLARASVKQGTPRLISEKAEVVKVVVIDRAQMFSLEGAAQPFLLRGKKPKVGFDEKARESQFASDLKSLVKVLAGIVGAEAGDATFAPGKIKPPVTVDWAHVTTQKLRLKRATVTVTAESGKADVVIVTRPEMTPEKAAQIIEAWEADQVKGISCANGMPDESKTKATPLAVLTCRAQSNAAPALQLAAVEGLGLVGDPRAAKVLSDLANNVGPSNPPLGAAALTAIAKLKAPAAPTAAPKAEEAAEDVLKPKAELLTGPIEHWFLSADVPLNDVKALSFDKDTNQVTLSDEPSTFYLGVNFLLGDIKETSRPFLQNLVFKAMLKASKHPLDSVGVAIGLRGQWLAKWGLNLDALTPFVGWTSTQEDAVETNGTVTKRARRNSELRFGVSLNLDQAVKWVGGK
jgi:hypothetical protein